MPALCAIRRGKRRPGAPVLSALRFFAPTRVLPAAYGQRVERRRYRRIFSAEVQFAKSRGPFCRHYALSDEGSAAPGAPVLSALRFFAPTGLCPAEYWQRVERRRYERLFSSEVPACETPGTVLPALCAIRRGKRRPRRSGLKRFAIFRAQKAPCSK